MLHQTQAKKPAVYVAERDLERLSNLADRPVSAGGRMLAEELERATVVRAGEHPSNFARLGSKVAYRDLLTGRTRALQLVSPADADVDADRLSVLSPVGAALIGLRPGDIFGLATEDGRPHILQLLAVGPMAEAAAAAQQRICSDGSEHA